VSKTLKKFQKSTEKTNHNHNGPKTP